MFQMRRFIAKNSAGLRVRTNPSLQSEQIGIVKPEGIVSFMDEVIIIHFVFENFLGGYIGVVVLVGWSNWRS